MQTAERSSKNDSSENVIYNRCLFAYYAVKNDIRGNVVELGSGEGYGINILSKNSDKYLALDKFPLNIEIPENVEFKEANFPDLNNIEDNLFDFLVSFQVIEHIKDDEKFIKEIYRVLKPGGIAFITTPNKLMSLTRNPWHVREYAGKELESKFKNYFSEVELYGVYGSETVNNYHNKNRESVKKITKWDIFNFQYILPRKLLQIPYDFLNRLNRKKLLKNNTSNVEIVSVKDFYLDTYTDKAFDIFIKAKK